MKLYSKDGVEVMSVTSIEHADGKVMVRGKMMKTMAMTIMVKPEDMAEGFRLLSLKTLLAMPGMLIKGWLRNRRARAGSAESAKNA
ncbi:hypothetical protein ACFOOP_01410 [Marinicaulis aureus]|uniref:Uncharacterized protein n=1 Tax=Hyphococcus aureus TaxID=2666033 RepID=A0ABW1KU00_9PROT